MENIEVVIIRKISFKFYKDFDYLLKINGDVVDGVSNLSVWSLWDLIEKLKNKREKLIRRRDKIDKEARLKQIIDTI